LVAELQATYNFVSNSNVPAMNIVQYGQFMQILNTSFWNPHVYEYPPGSNNIYPGHAISYIGVGMGFAARGVSEETMNAGIFTFRMGQSQTFYGSEFQWAGLGYESYIYWSGHH
jgi:hypothetical protein